MAHGSCINGYHALLNTEQSLLTLVTGSDGARSAAIVSLACPVSSSAVRVGGHAAGEGSAPLPTEERVAGHARTETQV